MTACANSAYEANRYLAVNICSGEKQASHYGSKSEFVRFGPIADKRARSWIVRFVPIAVIRDLSTKLRDQILLSMLARATAFGARQAHHVGRYS